MHLVRADAPCEESVRVDGVDGDNQDDGDTRGFRVNERRQVKDKTVPGLFRAQVRVRLVGLADKE